MSRQVTLGNMQAPDGWRATMGLRFMGDFDGQ